MASWPPLSSWLRPTSWPRADRLPPGRRTEAITGSTPEQYFDSSGAADFLEEETETEPARFFGYDPAIATVANGYIVPYRYEFAEPITRALLVNNRATLFDLQDVQGYNPVQPQRYVDYITALNGHGQEYHDANIFESGLDSPLLNLLNARYIVVPNDVPPGRTDLLDLRERHRTVYVDEQVRVLENAAALPRAWIVHSAQQTTADAALVALASGAVDPRTTALLEETPPALVNRQIQRRAPRLSRPTRRLHLRQDRDECGGLLVLSEVFDPDWKAYVNGKEAPIYRANHLFRAVEIPASIATVEFRYEVRLAFIGATITGATVGRHSRHVRGVANSVHPIPVEETRTAASIRRKGVLTARLSEIERDRDRVSGGNRHRQPVAIERCLVPVTLPDRTNGCPRNRKQPETRSAWSLLRRRRFDERHEIMTPARRG